MPVISPLRRNKASLAACASLLVLAANNQCLGHGALKSELVSAETQARIQDVARRRKELQERLTQARMKEQLALLQLRNIQTKLNVTTGALRENKHKLKKTESKINQCEQNISQTRSSQQELSDQAARRLREIYEGQHLNLI